MQHFLRKLLLPCALGGGLLFTLPAKAQSYRETYALGGGAFTAAEYHVDARQVVLYQGDYQYYGLGEERFFRNRQALTYWRYIGGKGQWALGVNGSWQQDELLDRTLGVQVAVRHEGRIGSLYFHKQLSHEWLSPEEWSRYGALTLWALLGKDFSVGGEDFRLDLSGQLLRLTQVERDDNSRRLDQGRVQLDLHWRLHPRWSLGLQGRWETDFRYTMGHDGIFGPDDSLLESPKPAGKLNTHAPTLALTLRARLGALPTYWRLP